MLAESHDEEQIIARVAALDIGKAELVCCVRVPSPAGGKRRLQEVTTHSTMTRLGWSNRLECDASLAVRAFNRGPSPITSRH